jgi:hypothetical protein
MRGRLHYFTDPDELFTRDQQLGFQAGASIRVSANHNGRQERVNAGS